VPEYNPHLKPRRIGLKSPGMDAARTERFHSHRPPKWAVELWFVAEILNNKLEKIMSDLRNLNAAVDALKTEVGDIGTQMDALLAALLAAQAGGNQAEIDTATQNIQAQVDALKAIAARDTPPVV
jgi:outer membrane murein-binding lipoprotein Lpp